MRLLLFTPSVDADDPILGFATTWIRVLARQMERIHVITMRAGRLELPENVLVYSVGKEKGYSEPRRALRFYQHMFHILKRDQIDISFSHMIPIFTVMAAPLLQVRNIPIVTWYAHLRLTWTLKLAHHLSHRVVASIAASYPYKHDKLNVIGQGIDTDLFAPDETVPEEPPIVLCVGRLSPVKDHPTLLKAVALVRERWKHPFRVVIVGGPAVPQDTAYARLLYKQAQTFGIHEMIRFEPPVPMTALPSWYRRCTVHVNMTPPGSGDKVILEAMSCGKPCLMANEGFRETLGRYAYSLIFRYGDTEDLAEKLIELLALSPRDREQIGCYLQGQVAQKHSLNNLAANLIKVFHVVRQHQQADETRC